MEGIRFHVPAAVTGTFVPIRAVKVAEEDRFVTLNADGSLEPCLRIPPQALVV